MQFPYSVEISHGTTRHNLDTMHPVYSLPIVAALLAGPVQAAKVQDDDKNRYGRVTGCVTGYAQYY